MTRSPTGSSCLFSGSLLLLFFILRLSHPLYPLPSLPLASYMYSDMTTKVRSWRDAEVGWAEGDCLECRRGEGGGGRGQDVLRAEGQRPQPQRRRQGPCISRAGTKQQSVRSEEWGVRSEEWWGWESGQREKRYWHPCRKRKKQRRRNRDKQPSRTVPLLSNEISTS